jgi:dynein intermediate chain
MLLRRTQTHTLKQRRICSSRPPKCFLPDLRTGLLSRSKQPKITYDKSVQTTLSTAFQTDPLEDEAERPAVGRETEHDLRARLLKEFDAERSRLDAEIAAERASLEVEKRAARLRGLEEEQRAAVLGSTDFLAFLDRSTKVTERALSDGYDYMKDYAVSGGQSATR